MNTRFAALALTLLGTASLEGNAAAQTTVTRWDFNSSPLAVNTSPATSVGTGTASSVGFNGTTYNSQATPTPANPTATDTSDITNSAPLSTDPGTSVSGTVVNYEWRIRGGDGTTGGNSATGNNGWSSFAPIGSQGAQFLTSTAGFNNIQISFDWSPTGSGEGKLQVQYTLNGSTYINLGIGAFTNTGGTTANTNLTSANTVNGGYLQSTQTAAFNNGIAASLSSIAAANNNPNFGIRLVSAATGADDTTSTGAALNNNSGNWRFDEVTISGTAVPEPGTCALVGLGLAGLGLLVRRQRRQAV